MKGDTNLLNQKLWTAANEYLQMQLSNGVTFAVPYHINRMSGYIKELLIASNAERELIETVLQKYKEGVVPYGKLRGKGTAAEILALVEQMMADTGPYDDYKSAESVQRILEVYGIGIDCSGLVYNVLSATFAGMDILEQFVNSLSWPDPEKKGVNYAGADLFAASSIAIDWNAAQAGDLILMKSRDGSNYSHIAMLLSDETSKLKILQSALTTQFYGTTVEDLHVINNRPVFNFTVIVGKDWMAPEMLRRFELRRLSFFIQNS